MSHDYRLDKFSQEPDPAEPELVESDQDDDDDEPCIQCGAVDAVQNPHEVINEMLPPEARCRVCLKDHL